MKKKTIALLLVMMMVFGITVGGTIAYLTDSKQVTNTFTVGNVQIKLDEAKTDVAGIVQMDDNRKEIRTEEGNRYKLIPNAQYTKDPTVTVLEGSEEAYVRVLVTISYSSQWDEIFKTINEKRAENNEAMLTAKDVLVGYDETNWTYKSNVENDDNTRTYEFWYNNPVAGTTGGNKLPALFTGIKVPGEVTNEQLETLVTYGEDEAGATVIKDQFEIDVVAHAIQTAGFADATDAWDNGWGK